MNDPRKEFWRVFNGLSQAVCDVRFSVAADPESWTETKRGELCETLEEVSRQLERLLNETTRDD